MATWLVAWPLDARADMPTSAVDPDDVLPPDYLELPIGQPPVTPPPLAAPEPPPPLPTPEPLRAAPVVIRRLLAPRPRLAVRLTARPRPIFLGRAAFPTGGDLACLELLGHARVPYRLAGSVRGVKTPIEITGLIGGVRLVPRAGRAPIMDCQLARTLVELAPAFRRAGVTGLSFSGAYDYRTRRDSAKLSAHAHGLAIDVHALQTRTGLLDVKRDYPRDGRRWQGVGGRPESVAACLGRPARKSGRTLRALACRLKLDPVMRYVLSPDTNTDHHDHLHLEAYPVGSSDLLTGNARPVQQGRRTPRR